METKSAAIHRKMLMLVSQLPITGSTHTALAEREADLLPVGYFHVVFTLPAEVADIAFAQQGYRL